MQCEKCNQDISNGNKMTFKGQTLCDDCYMDVCPTPTPNTYYENDSAEFMRRLKRTHSVRKQRFH
jgi:hypothetical protein